MARILFVDAEPKTLHGMRRLLRRYRDEWNMEFVDRGQDALRRLSESQFDVIVSEMHLPDLPGRRLLSEVKGRYPEIVRIVLTGAASADVRENDNGIAHQYLAKPCDPETLRDAISRACAVREYQSSAALCAAI